MAILTVGAGLQYATISAAVAASQNGDTVNVRAGTYTNDFIQVNDNITIRSFGGAVIINEKTPPPNQKAAITVDGNLTIDGLTITGVAIPAAAGNNGAAIRFESGNLTVLNSTIYGNQDGILANADATAKIDIENSEFYANGAGDGYSHNIYIGDVASLTVNNSYFHDSIVGHEIKSRAQVTTITNNRIQDGIGGTGSYEIDLPNAGVATITGNTIEKSATSQNPNAISYGEEGNNYAASSLDVENNTIITDRAGATAVRNSSSVAATVSNDKLYGFSAANILSGPGATMSNILLATEPALNTAHIPAVNYPALVPGTPVVPVVPVVPIVPVVPAIPVVPVVPVVPVPVRVPVPVPVVPTGPQITVTQNGVTTLFASGSTVTTKAGKSSVTLGSAGGTIDTVGSDTVFGGTVASTVNIGTSATVVGGASLITVNGGTGPSTVIAGAGGLTYNGATGVDTVAALISPSTINGGSGGGLFAAGAGSTINAGGGLTVEFGGNGAILNAIGSTGVLFAATGGDATMNSSKDTGTSVFFAAASSGNLTFITGAGTDLLALGSGTNTVTLGSGSATVFANAGAIATKITAGTGSAYIAFAGTTTTLDLAASATHTARNEYLFGFTQGTDHLALTGFSAAQTAATLASAKIVGGGTILTLADGTGLWFVGNNHVTAAAFT